MRIKRKLWKSEQYGTYSMLFTSKKFINGQQTDQKIKKYIPIQMPKGTDLPNGAEVEILEGFISPFERKDGTIDVKIVCMKYDLCSADEGNQDMPESFSMIDEEVPF